MIKIIIIGLVGIAGVLGIEYWIPYFEKDECNALQVQHEQFKDKGWYATRDWVETCREYGIILPELIISRMYEK